MGRDLGLANRLRAEGLKVVEVDGWRERGSSTFSPRGSVNHHTAGPRRGNAPSLGTCINGRPDVPGPLCHVLMARDLTCYVIASGRANHAGRGGFRGLVGNSSVYGLEVENVGTSDEPATPALLDAMYRVHAAFLRGIDRPDVSLVCQHEEWTSRKIDFHDLAFEPFRQNVRRQLEGGNPNPPTDEEQELMAAKDEILREIEEAKNGTIAYLARVVADTEARLNDRIDRAGAAGAAVRDAESGRVYVVTASGKLWVQAEELNFLALIGEVQRWPGFPDRRKIPAVDPKYLDGLPEDADLKAAVAKLAEDLKALTPES